MTTPRIGCPWRWRSSRVEPLLALSPHQAHHTHFDFHERKRWEQLKPWTWQDWEQVMRPFRGIPPWGKEGPPLRSLTGRGLPSWREDGNLSMVLEGEGQGRRYGERTDGGVGREIGRQRTGIKEAEELSLVERCWEPIEDGSPCPSHRPWSRDWWPHLMTTSQEEKHEEEWHPMAWECIAHFPTVAGKHCDHPKGRRTEGQRNSHWGCHNSQKKYTERLNCQGTAWGSSERQRQYTELPSYHGNSLGPSERFRTLLDFQTANGPFGRMHAFQ